MSLLDSFSFQVAEEPTDERTAFQKLGALHLLTALALVAALAVGALLRRRRQPPPPIAPAKRTDGDGLTVFYASQKGHSKNFAERLVAELDQRRVSFWRILLIFLGVRFLVFWTVLVHLHCVEFCSGGWNMLFRKIGY